MYTSSRSPPPTSNRFSPTEATDWPQFHLRAGLEFFLTESGYPPISLASSEHEVCLRPDLDPSHIGTEELIIRCLCIAAMAAGSPVTSPRGILGPTAVRDRRLLRAEVMASGFDSATGHQRHRQNDDEASSPPPRIR